MIDAISGAGLTPQAKAGSASMGKDDFLRLLVAQLENQDPLDPLDNAEFTAQLAQFSSLEQLFDVNKNLKAFHAMQASLDKTGAVSYLDREVKAKISAFMLQDGEGEINFHLSGPADELFMGIYDQAGDLVRRESLGPTQAGEGYYKWDGKGNNGSALPDGLYTFDIAGSGPYGRLEATGYLLGKVEGVSFEGGSFIFSVGGVKVGKDDILEIK